MMRQCCGCMDEVCCEHDRDCLSAGHDARELKGELDEAVKENERLGYRSEELEDRLDEYKDDQSASDRDVEKWKHRASVWKALAKRLWFDIGQGAP